MRSRAVRARLVSRGGGPVRRLPGRGSSGWPATTERPARWTPPEGWSRLIAWVSPEEKKALKRVAVEAEVSVADLIRALAAGLASESITHEELLGHVRKGALGMEKIPTLFERDDDFRVVNRPRPECAWVFEGEGTPTKDFLALPLVRRLPESLATIFLTPLRQAAYHHWKPRMSWRICPRSASLDPVASKYSPPVAFASSASSPVLASPIATG